MLAYFSGGQVVNLNGLINSYAYYKAMCEGHAAEFVRAQDVALVFDTAGFAPSDGWSGILRARYEHRFYARNVGLSSLFKNVFPQVEQGSPFMFKA